MRRLLGWADLIGAVAVGVGLVLLLVEVVRTVAGQSLGGFGLALLWVGFGLLVVGLVVVLLSLTVGGAELEAAATPAARPAARTRKTAPARKKTAATAPADDEAPTSA